MQIDEFRQENSGMPQGTLVKRHRIPYPEVPTDHTTRPAVDIPHHSPGKYMKDSVSCFEEDS